MATSLLKLQLLRSFSAGLYILYDNKIELTTVISGERCHLATDTLSKECETQHLPLARPVDYVDVLPLPQLPSGGPSMRTPPVMDHKVLIPEMTP